MNFRNRKLTIGVRIVFGLLMIFSGGAGLLMMGKPIEGASPFMIETMRVLIGTGLFQMIKLTELIAGLMLVAGFLPSLAVIFLAPVCIGIIVFNAFTDPALVIVGVIVSVANAFLGYAYWEKYKALFTRT